MDRFFVEVGFTADPGARLRLEGAEAHHLRVKRVAEGDRVRLFDGGGREVAARVLRLGKAGADLEVLGDEVTPAAPNVAITVGLAIPKGKRVQVFLEKATELGVAAIFPLVTRRTVGGARDAVAAMRSDKWRRTTVEAAKQSGAVRLPELLEPRALEEVLAGAAGADLRIILDPGEGAAPLRELLARPCPARALVLVGPEGGFDDAEVAAATAAGFARARLGRTILRIETAALAVVAAIVVAWE